MYNFIIRIVFLLININCLFSKRHSLWLREQKKIIKNTSQNSKKVIWIHCASMGEYESIKPILMELKNSQFEINITFFSPSGHKHFNDFHLVKKIYYLPIDIKNQMDFFIKKINPIIVIVSQNDIWPNMITILRKNNIPVYCIGLKLNQKKINNYFIKYYYKKYLNMFSHIFCIDDLTYNFLNENKISESTKINNIRFNQVLNELETSYQDDLLTKFLKQKTTIIYASIEKEDYPIIIDHINSKSNMNHIIVPHEIDFNTIESFTKITRKKHILYSNLKNGLFDTNIIIIDVFGLLKKLYKFSTIAYVGGGFKNGVHNTLEPAAYGNTIVFGPNYKNFPETLFFIKQKVGFSVKNKEEFKHIFNKIILDKKQKKDIGKINLNYLNAGKQDINHIINYINNDLQINT